MAILYKNMLCKHTLYSQDTMKKTFAAAALGLSLVANIGAADVAAAKQGAETSYQTGTRIRVGNLTLLRCRTESGKNATYVVTTSPDLLTPFTYSITHKDQPAPVAEGIPQGRGHYIVIPEKFIAQSNRDTALFAIAHECAHQELGHTIMLNEGADQPLVQAFEREADCLAPAIIMQDYGMSAERTAQIITRAFSSRMMRDHDRVRDPETAVHDSAQQRLANTMACLRMQTAGPRS